MFMRGNIKFRIFVLIILISSLFLIVACDRQTNQVNCAQQIEQNNLQIKSDLLILGQYNLYIRTFNDQSTLLFEKLTAWNTLMEQLNKGVKISKADLESANKDYEDQANILKPIIIQVESYMVQNEVKLKEFGIDTLSEKQLFETVFSAIENNTISIQKSMNAYLQ
jgi:hypothetical protein